MINDLINNNYHCILGPTCRSGEHELLVMEPIYYDSNDRDFKLIGNPRKRAKANIYSKIIGIGVGFHEYDRNKEYKNGYYLLFPPTDYYVKVIKIMYNRIYIVELMKNGTPTDLPLSIGSRSYISDNTFRLILHKSVEEI